MSWLDENVKKDFDLIYGNSTAKVLQKKIGLKKMLENIQSSKFEYLHGYNTCLNESLNNFKTGGGITRKNLNQWGT